MWNNIGRKVQKLAKFVCWFGIIASSISGIITIISGIQMLSNRYYTNAGWPQILIGAGIIVVGSLLSWMGSWVTYAIGEAAEAAEKNL